MKKILIILAVIIVILAVAKDQIIKSTVTVVGSKVLGTQVKLGGFSLGVVKRAIRIKDFKIYNPEGFPKGAIIDIPEISVDYSLLALLTGKLHARSVVFELKEVNVVKNKEGKLNVDSLRVAQAGKEPAAGSEKKPGPSKAMPIQIDTLNLNMGKVVYTDMTAGEKPSVQVFEIGINKTYNNINSVQQLAALILTEPMKQTAIKGAKIYGAATLLGAGFLPVGIAATLTGKDSSQADFDVAYDTVYQASIEVTRQMGEITSEDKSSGIIKGDVDGSSVTIRITKTSEKSTQVIVAARKIMLPKPQIAGGVLHQISGKLGK
ncbi:hypothetical protein ACFL1D_00625 [Candidatus Omnitrophota bacterium]